MTNEDLDRYEAITNAATPGPWTHDPNGRESICGAGGGNVFSGSHNWTEDGPELNASADDIAFACTAREAMPRLIARVRELEKDAAELEARRKVDKWVRAGDFTHSDHPRCVVMDAHKLYPIENGQTITEAWDYAELAEVLGGRT